MKKTYIAPAVTEMTMVTEAMVAASVVIDGNGSVNTKDPGAQLGKEQQGDWDNIWK